MIDERTPVVMILGASFLQVPMIETANRAGMRSVVVDQDPSAPGAAFAGEFHQVSTIDAEAVLELARRIRPDGITTAATDAPIRVVAAVAEALGLPAVSPTTALACTDKAVMIRRLAESGVPHPMWEVVGEPDEARRAAESIGLPCILKPVDSSGSRGVVLLESFDRVDAAFAYSLASSRTGQVLVEEFLQGPEVSVEVFHDGQRAHVLAVTDKATTGAPHFVETGHNEPSSLPSETVTAIGGAALAAVEAVGIDSGPAHVEIIVTARGPVVVELGARMGGDCITSDLVPLSTGIDMTALVLDQAVGRAVTVPAPTTAASAIRFLEQPEGALEAVRGLERALAVPGVVDVALLKELGHHSSGTHASGDRLGYVIAQGADVLSAVTACEAAVALIEVEVNR